MNYRKEKMVKRINAILEAIVGGIAGFITGITILGICIWFNYCPSTMIGEWVLLLSPIILAVFGILYTIWDDIWMFKKEW